MASAGPIPSGTRSELDRIRQTVAAYFPVYETRVGPQSVLFAVHVAPASLEKNFDALRQELGRLGYIPILRRETGEEFVEVLRRPRLGPRRPWINLVLLGATLATTVFAGAMIWLTYVGRLVLGPTDFLYGALYFALPLMTILGVHESAHYVVARRRHLDASLPYFIPIPPPYILGTFGAFVSIREPFPDRKTLFDVGAAGPLAGFAVAIPIALAGLSLSSHSPVLPANYCGPSILGQSYGNLLLGPSLFWAFLSAFFPPSVISLHPLALAGWVGVLVTAINLLPAGSLDGGHVFRALLGERARYVSYLAAAALFGLGLFYVGWLLFAVLVILLGLRHPPPLNDSTPLDRKRLAVGAVVALILVSGFVLIPLSAPTGQLSLSHESAVQAPSQAGSIAANLSVTVANGDPVVHGLVFSYAVENVSVVVNGTATYLTGQRLAAWEANDSWVVFFPNGTNLTLPAGGSASVPSAHYLTVDGGATLQARAQFSDTEAAQAVTFSFHVSEFCLSGGGGSASVTLPPAQFA
jgi:membrane-associated protease RseP (regulator of RpoE activity)